ncbi:hypothetical protein EV693_106100 [Nicoletella semolina]|uniref:Cof subfamily protein (Haloacid dehalogenase superfamily)/HAD superfamily hydrolase (TIGR01484 family) n=1 Tax=Nicoletella semolina TaxID=271160 RepID=A0A4R2N8U6_9PAST|nr:Cof-type HAD-IIB family hydrolase [Nicoletella semolina]MDH2924465.1 hypothetical protein [Nicoletella semolina]TCP17410.1 hypothetical protein EV693_106100 [Nicoletella semolina]
MANQFRAVISDLDGTLLNHKQHIGDFTVKTVERLAKKGLDIFIATGRSFVDVKQLMKNCSLEEAILVTSNGARASTLTGQLLYSNYIPEDIVNELFRLPFERTRVCLNSYQGDEWFINVDVAALRQYYEHSGFMYNVVNFERHHTNQAEKLFFIAQTIDDLLPIEQKIKQLFANQLQLTYSSPQCLEIMNYGVCKANTLSTLMNNKGYNLAHCIAFGDGLNDIEMLTQAGRGCIMENADPRLKQALPSNEIIGNHKDEAVAYYLCKEFEL